VSRPRPPARETFRLIEAAFAPSRMAEGPWQPEILRVIRERDLPLAAEVSESNVMLAPQPETPADPRLSAPSDSTSPDGDDDAGAG